MKQLYRLFYCLILCLFLSHIQVVFASFKQYTPTAVLTFPFHNLSHSCQSYDISRKRICNKQYAHCAHTSAVHACAAWSEQDFARAIQSLIDQGLQQGISQAEIEQEILEQYEYYQIPAFAAYVKKFAGYRTHIKELHNRLVSQKCRLHRFFNAIGFLSPEYVQQLKLSEKLYAEILKEEYEQQKNLRQQAALATEQAAKAAQQAAQAAQREAEYAQALAALETQIVPVQGKDLDGIVGEWSAHTAGEHGERYQNRIDAANGVIVSGMDSVLCRQATNMMRECGVNHERFAIRYENEVQQLLHSELIMLANNFAPLYEQLRHNESLHALNRLAVKSLDVGRLYNQQGNVAAASKIADFGWATLYFVKEISIGLGEGAMHGVVNVGTMVLHPLDTIAHGVAGASKVALALSVVLSLDEEFNIACMTGRTDEFEDKARQMTQRIEYTAGALKQQCAKLSVRDVGRLIGTFAAEALVMDKLSGALSEFYEFSTTHATRFAKEFAKDERVLVETVEGLQVLIADEGAQVGRASGMHLQDAQVPGGKKVKGVEGVRYGELVKDFEKVIDEFVVTENIKKHVFSDKHMIEGIMNLGPTKEVILDQFIQMMREASVKGLLKQGHNEIIKKISGFDATVRFFIKENQILSFDGYVGISSRTIGNKVIL